MQRSKDESPAVVYQFKDYTKPVNVAALASVCERLREYKHDNHTSTTEYNAFRRMFPSVAPLDKNEVLPESIGLALKDMTKDDIDEAASELIQYTQVMLGSNGLFFEAQDIIFVSTTPRDRSEMYHRDGGANDSTFRLIIYGTNTGPGTYFAEGDCNLVDANSDRIRESYSTTGFAPQGWNPPSENLREVHIEPRAGSAVLFTGNMCHKRESSEDSRWSILINLQHTGRG